MNSITMDYFPIAMVAKACGISRSTILRLEEKGLLTPVYTSPESGRRYYDNHNISRILQIQHLHAMGLSTNEIIQYYKSNGDITGGLSILQEKLSLLQRSIDELSIRAQKIPALETSIIELPEYVCITKEHHGLYNSEKYNAMYEFYSEAIEKGYRLSPEPLFIINKRTDYLDGYISSEPFDFITCIPLQKETATADAVTFPACTVLSVLIYGDYKLLNKAILLLGEEIKRLNLTPTDYQRTIGIVGPYTGTEISSDMYCTRLAVPINSQS